MSSHILELSPEVISLIADNIEFNDIPSFCLTCKTFYSVFNCESGKVRKIRLKTLFETKTTHEIVDIIEHRKQNFGTLYCQFKDEYDAVEDYSFYLNQKIIKFMGNPENIIYLDTVISHVLRDTGLPPAQRGRTIIDHAYLFVGYAYSGVSPTSSHHQKHELYAQMAQYQDHNCIMIRELYELFYSKNIDMTRFNALNRKMIVEELLETPTDILPFHKFLTNLPL